MMVCWNCRDKGSTRAFINLKGLPWSNNIDILFLTEVNVGIKRLITGQEETWDACHVQGEKAKGKKGGLVVMAKDGIQLKLIKKSEFLLLLNLPTT